MSTQKEYEGAIRQGYAQLESIREMVANLREAREEEDDNAIEKAESVIHEDALSVEVKSGWYNPCGHKEDREPQEFRILLCTGGPACHIVGKLDYFNRPTTDLNIEVQDWFIPWQAIELTMEDRDVLREYAECFYYGQ